MVPICNALVATYYSTDTVHKRYTERIFGKRYIFNANKSSNGIYIDYMGVIFTLIIKVDK